MLDKLEEMEIQFCDIEQKLQQPEISKNPTQYSKYLKEHGGLQRIILAYRDFKKIRQEIKSTEELQQDPEFQELAQEELEELYQREKQQYQELQEMLIEDDEDENRNAIIEIRAGTGGEEASLFASDLYQMYTRFAEKRKWKVEILDSSYSDLGGIKEIIFCLKGKRAYGLMKHESGGHRVQRVPITESSGRIHTSACTVVTLPEAREVEININPKDLKIDTMCASGPGGQNVNKTSSAVRITHLPTGTVVSCQDTPEQYKNKMKAMRILRTRLHQKMQQEQHEERNKLRRGQQGSGDRSDRIRTYNFPQNRITDHRINLSVYNLETFLQGEIDEIVNSLQKYDRQKRLEELKPASKPE